MSWVPGFTVPPPHMGWVPRMGSPCEWNMHAMQHMHAYAFICTNIRTCMPTSTYACIAYA